MNREIVVKLSKKNFYLLKNASKHGDINKTVNKALNQFFDKNHKMKVRALLKSGYKKFGKFNLHLCKVLEEDNNF